MINRSFATLMILGCLVSAAKASDDSTTTPNSIAELQQSIAQLMARYDIPAVGIAMVDADGPVWVGALGKANREKDINADEHSLFRIASTSKMFVALSVLKLTEQGQLTLQDKLLDVAPDVAFSNRWADTHPIRVVHLLEHTTGWDEQHYPELARNDPMPSTLKQDIDFHPHSRQSRWPPGSRFSYTNSGPAVAANVVEKISGHRFEDFVQLRELATCSQNGNMLDCRCENYCRQHSAKLLGEKRGC